MRRLAAASLLLVLPVLAPPARAQRAAPDDPVVREFTVPVHAGKVSSADLVAGLLDAYGLDPDMLDVPDARIRVDGFRGRLKLRACRELLLDSVSFTRADERLVVTIDRERTRELRRDLRRRIASLFGDEVGERRYALDIPDDLDASRPLVVLIHGVESGPAVWDDLRAFLAEQEAPPQVATFGYPNDEACARVARELASRLAALGEQPVAIVAHSMGGLVARAVVEDPKLDPGNVEILVMLGTPQHGSALAGLRVALETAAFADRVSDAEPGTAYLRALRAGLRDGLGEAGGDLLPGSVFLTKLNRRQRNPAVDYHIVLGTRAPLDAQQVHRIGERVAAPVRDSWVAAGADDVESWFAHLDEVVDGRGDGAVSIARGRLDGVEPLLVPLDHLGLVRARGLDAHPVFVRIAGWLEAATMVTESTGSKR